MERTLEQAIHLCLEAECWYKNDDATCDGCPTALMCAYPFRPTGAAYPCDIPEALRTLGVKLEALL